MARSMALLMLAGLILMSVLPNYTVAQLKSMCISQFALANLACAVLPTAEVARDFNQTNLQVASDDDDDDDDNDGDDADENERRHSRRNGNGHGQRQHGDGNGHRQRRRNGNGHRQRGGNGSAHRHRSESGHGHGTEHEEEPRANRDCCRWLEEVDGSCVCTTLLRLPPFLVKPKHTYSIKVGNSCSRTFNCGGA